jgi:hypothetical protein
MGMVYAGLYSIINGLDITAGLGLMNLDYALA